MGTITPTYIESIAVLAIKTDLGGTEYVEADLDIKDHASGPFDEIGFVVGYAPGASPITGGALTIKVFSSSDGGATRDQLAKIHQFDPFADTNQTTVDADSSSGQKVLNVAATTAFTVGDRVIIDHDASGGGREFGQIASISSGVSITLEDNLTNTHTAAQADTVKVWQTFPIPLATGGISFIRLRLENDDTDSADDAIVKIDASARAGYTTTA
jgi:hypothetical protein